MYIDWEHKLMYVYKKNNDGTNLNCIIILLKESTRQIFIEVNDILRGRCYERMETMKAKQLLITQDPTSLPRLLQDQPFGKFIFRNESAFVHASSRSFSLIELIGHYFP